MDLYLIQERKQYHELSRTATDFLLFVAFGVFLTDLCSISEYILVNRYGIFAIFVRFKPNADDPADQL